MPVWLAELRGALFTWVVVPFAVIAFVWFSVRCAWVVGGSPRSPLAFQIPWLLTICAAALIFLMFLAFRHGTNRLRTRTWGNLAEIAVLFLTFLLSVGLVSVFVNGPKTLSLVLFGQTYHVPTAYAPYVWRDADGKDVALVFEVCGPTQTPRYATDTCNWPRTITTGKGSILEVSQLSHMLKGAGAIHSGDTLSDLGTHQLNAETGAIIYRNPFIEIHLWLEDDQRVQVLRLCEPGYHDRCSAMARIGEVFMDIPVSNLDVTASRSFLRATAQTWLDRVENWRCTSAEDCPPWAD